MPKPDHLINHLNDSGNKDSHGPIQFGADTERLRFTYRRTQGGWNSVARYVKHSMQSSMAWFPDANVAFLDGTSPVWDALRLVGLGDPHGPTVISHVVEAEMSEWLSDPFRNQGRAAAIKSAMDNETWIRRFQVDPFGPLKPALYGYTHLLGFRRSLARPFGTDGTTLLDTDASDRSRTMNTIQNRIGLRAVALAKKGRNEFETTGSINVNDEMHCMVAILYGLQNDCNCAILTADADYIEIFYKAQWFIDTHYRAWLTAKLIYSGEYGEPAGQLHETDGYFEGPLTLYRRPTAHLREVLPPYSRSVRVGVVYVAPDGTVDELSFPFELEMLDMLVDRGATGRCTELFGDANIHVDLGPIKTELDGLYLGIGNDSCIDFETHGFSSSLARLDVAHSIYCCERRGF